MLEKSKELAYWIGLVQSDGCFRRYVYRKYAKPKEYVTVELQVKDFELIQRFKEITWKIFRRGSGPFLLSRGIWKYCLGVKTLLTYFDEIDVTFKDPPKPPIWATENKEYFGAYLAGVIDGDGDVRIKRKRYPQCIIRISSGKHQTDLAKSIEEILKCAVSVTPRQRVIEYKGHIIKGKWFSLEFLVSSKTQDFVKNHLIPYLVLKRKKDKLAIYISKFEN